MEYFIFVFEKTCLPASLLNFTSQNSCPKELFGNRFIPKSPSISVEFDTNSDRFKMDDETEKSICKFDYKIGNCRIVIMTTKKCLQFMARSHGLAIDGTFRSCPM